MLIYIGDCDGACIFCFEVVCQLVGIAIEPKGRGFLVVNGKGLGNRNCFVFASSSLCGSDDGCAFGFGSERVTTNRKNRSV